MKYRPLHSEELENLREDFVQFLAANSITGDDWVRIKKEMSDQANQLIEMFSDLVWDKVLGNINFLEMRASKELRVVRFADEKIQMIVLKVNSDDFDFTNPEHIKAIAEGALDLNSSGLEILKGDRDYRAEKKMEVFVMMEEGARPCKEVFWKSIQRMIPPEGSTPAS